MEVMLMPRDRTIIQRSLDLFVKVCESIEKLAPKVGVATLQVEGVKGHCLSLQERVAEWCGNEERGFTLDGEYEIPHPELSVVRDAVSLYLEKISKIETAQVEMGIEPGDTEARAADARDLADRLQGQLAIAGVSR